METPLTIMRRKGDEAGWFETKPLQPNALSGRTLNNYEDLDSRESGNDKNKGNDRFSVI